MRLLILVSALAASGCVLPRSAILGQTAAPMGAGNAEAGLSTGLSFQTDNSPPVGTPTNNTVASTATVWAPGVEGNAQVGITDWLGLNFHLSQAGLQPGLKVNILSGNLNLAVLPEMGFGFATQGDSTTLTTGGTSKTTGGNTLYYFSFLAGLKLLVSHSSGIYGGLGYDFQALSTSTVDNKGFNQGSESQQANIITAAIGYEFKFKAFSIRPEVALLFLPGNTTGVTPAGSMMSTSTGGGSGFVFYPNITFAVGSSGHPATAPAEQTEGMKPEELSIPPLMRAP